LSKSFIGVLNIRDSKKHLERVIRQIRPGTPFAALSAWLASFRRSHRSRTSAPASSARPGRSSRRFAPATGISPGAFYRGLDHLRRQLRPQLRVPAFYARMDRESQVMTLAIGASILLHAILLATRFSFPTADLFNTEASLDIVLVNSKSTTKPFFADVLAQANLDRGGNTDKKRHAKTPLPALHRKVEGDALVQATARQQQLEEETRRLLAQLKGPDPILPELRKNPNDTPPQPSGTDLNTSALAIARLEAQIAKQMEEYEQRPKKAFVGARAQEVKFAQYAEDWRIKVERVGTLNYPPAARGNNRALQLTVEIKADGSVYSIHVDRSSGVKLIDQAAQQIVRMAAPFPAFPPSLKGTDIIVITRTWTFEPGGGLSTE
jgi:periplasmic protein TonB